jgi:hypothetical protein
MFDLDATLRKFYGDKVAIPKSVRDELRDARAANETRLENGLTKAGKPKVKRHVRQGGYAMKTVVQQHDNAYDIDNGALFTYDSLLGPNKGPMSAPDARKMVCDALQDDKFKTKPEIRTNCVRVSYNDGYWVDVPVYRERVDANTKTTYLELASADWKRTDPEGVTAWFQDMEKRLSRDFDEGGDPQFRRVVAYVKALAVSRKTWNWPNGFMISVLAESCFTADDRDDVSLRKTLKAMHSVLVQNMPIMHPKIKGERLDVKGDPDVRCVEMRDKLAELLKELQILDDPKCNAEQAASVWDTVYGTDYFRDKFGGRGSGAKAALSFASSDSPSKFERGDGGRYG